MVTSEHPLELYRCMGCNRLVNDRDLLARGGCNCGSKMVRGGAPGNLIENIKVLWWVLKFK